MIRALLALTLDLMPDWYTINVYSSEFHLTFKKYYDATYGPFFNTKFILLCLLRSFDFMLFFSTEKIMNGSFCLKFSYLYIASLLYCKLHSLRLS